MEENTIVTENPAEEEGLSIKDILYIIRKHLIAIIIFIVAGAAIGFIAGKAKNKFSPSYTAKATMMVTVDSENISMTQAYSYSNYISDTFVVFIEEDVVIDKVAEKEKSTYDLTTKEIQNNLSVSLKSDTLIVSLSYTCADPDEAVTILNDVVDSSVATANAKDESGNVKYPLLYGNISDVTYANKDKVTVASVTSKYFLIGTAVGLVGAVVYVFLKEIFDNSFKSNDEIERELGIPVLADIPYYSIKDVDSVSGKGGNK